MSEAAAPAPAPAAPAKKTGWGLFKMAGGGLAGLATGVLGVYATAVVDKVAKPPKPLANFAASADGLTVTCQNLASGQSGVWDFGDGSSLVDFKPDDKEVQHKYDNPGTYNVRLVVRNFLNEENERTVGVVVSTAPKSGDAPAVAKLTMEKVGKGTAPATFRVKGELTNAQSMLLDPGAEQQRPELLPAGAFERVVVYEQPGRFAYRVFAISGSKVEMKYETVEVAAPPAGSLSAVAKVTDTGTRVERQIRTPSVAVRVPEKPAGPFERVLPADAGFTVTDVKVGAVVSKAVKNVKAELSADKKSVRVSGEWTGATDATNQKAGGSDPMIPLVLTQERAVPYAGTPQSVSAPLAFAGSFSPTSDDWSSGALAVTLKLPAPPADVTNLQRKVVIDLHEMGVGDGGRPQDWLVLKQAEPSKPVEETVIRLSNREQRIVRMERLATGDVKVTVFPPSGVNSRASK